MKKNCLTCNKEMRVKPSNVKRGWGKFCSKSCQYKGNPKIVNGYWTGKKRPDLLGTGASKTMFKKGVEVWNKGMKGFLAAEKHWSYGKARVDMMGENNPNWRGGVSQGNLKERGSLKYKIWRRSVFKRDNFACVICGDNKGGNLEADHIKPFSLYPESRFDINNGRTLCKPCHKKTDSYGNFSYMRAMKGGGAHENV